MLSILCTISALAGPTLSAPVLLPGDADIGPAAGTQDEPWLAEGDGTTWLLAWRDSRANLAGTQGGVTTDIWGIRVDADGTPVDPVSFPIASTPWNESTPRAAWNGAEWLVSYEADAATPFYYGQGVYARRVGADGLLVDAAGILVADDANDAEALWDVASDGSDWALLWQDVDPKTGTYALMGATMDPSGAVGAPRTVYNSGPAPWNARLAWATDRYMAAWSAWDNNDDIFVLPLDADLTALSAEVGVSTDGRSAIFPDIAAGDGEFYVSWFDDTYGAVWTEIRGTPVDLDGVATFVDGVSLSEDDYPLFAHPTSAWMGDGWLTAWEFGAASDIYASLTDADGNFLSSVNATNEVDYFVSPTSAPAPDGALLGWTASYGELSDFEIEATSLAADGTLGQVAQVSLAAPAQHHPAIAAGVDEYLVVAESQTADGMRIVAWRTDAWGQGIDAEPIEIAAGSALYDPVAAWNGTVWFVVWVDLDVDTPENGVVGLRLDTDGVPLDTAPIALMAGYQPAVAANTAGDFLVTASVPVSVDGHDQRLYGVRVDGNGAILDTNYLQLGVSYAVDSDIAAHGTGWLVTWSHFWSHDSALSDALYNTVDATGVVGTEQHVRTVGSIDKETGVDVASDGSTALVVWSDAGNIRGRRLDQNAALLGNGNGFVISSAKNSQLDPDVVWHGGAFYVAWTDWRANPGLEPGEGDVYMTKVTKKGVVSSPKGEIVAASDMPEGGVALAGQGSRAIFVWSALHDEAPYASFRVDSAWLGAGPNPPPMAAAAESLIAGGCSTTPAAGALAGLMAAIWLRRRSRRS